MANNINGAKYRNAPPRVIKRVLAAEREITAGGCWLWLGDTSHDGYGEIKYRCDGKRPHVYVHRLVYIWQVDADLDDSLELDHTCHDPEVCTVPAKECPHRRCFNPDHLEPVTTAVNLSRSGAVSGVSTHRDRCSKGHLYTKANTRWYKGTRQCRTCHRSWRAESYQRTGTGRDKARKAARTIALRQGRTCEICGADISHRIRKAKYCEGCSAEVAKCGGRARFDVQRKPAA